MRKLLARRTALMQPQVGCLRRAGFFVVLSLMAGGLDAQVGPWPNPTAPESSQSELVRRAHARARALERQQRYRVLVASAAMEGPSAPQPLQVDTHQVLAGPPLIDPRADSTRIEFIGPPLGEPFLMLGGAVRPGTRSRLLWNANQAYAGGEQLSPVIVTHGDRPGPVLCLTAGIHGDELNGVEIVRRISRDVSPERLAGTIVSVPIVNLFGFGRGSRYLPDRRDLNRFFPGSRFGSIASRIADSFFENVIRRCDALVDFHTGSFERVNLPQVRADLREPAVLEFTRGFGAVTVLHSEGSKGMLRVAAAKAGIPAVTFEVGGPGQLQAEEIGTGIQAILTLIHKLGMVRDAPEWLEPQPFFYESRWVRSDSGGMLISDVKLGERVVKGQLLGRVVDPLQDQEFELTSDVAGQVIGMAQNQVVLPGYAVFHIGEATSERGAVDAAQSGAQQDVPYEEDAPSDRSVGRAADDTLDDEFE